MSYDFDDTLTIDPENPEYHHTPSMCRRCGVIYYFGGHYCTERNKPSKAFKRAIQGYYDGE